jgi:hypothetical protein
MGKYKLAEAPDNGGMNSRSGHLPIQLRAGADNILAHFNADDR